MLTVESLCVKFGAIVAVGGVDLVVKPGELVAIIGANAAGKSTTLNAIMGAVRSSAGSVVIGGTDMSGWPEHRIARAGVRHVPEGGGILNSLTVNENLRVGGTGMTRNEVVSGLDLAYERFPRLAQRRSAFGGTLSGGERQMLSIARATLANPRLLLLDEPSFGLAPTIVNQVFELIEGLKRDDISVLLAEQNAVRALEVADRVYVLQKGQVVLEGTPAELEKEAALVESYLG